MQGITWSRTAAAVLIGLLGGACQKSSAEPPSGVVFVLVDALRADRLGCYGNPRNTSPNMDALAAESTLFTNAIAPSPWTLPTMATIWTSLHPTVHGAIRMSDLMTQNVRPVTALDESRETFAEVLRGNGFRTAAFIDGSYPRKAFGLAQGFEVFLDAELPGIRLNVEAMFDWLDRERPKKFFAYVHTVEVHSPYSPAKLRPPKTEVQDLVWQRNAHVLAEERDRYKQFDFNPDYEGKIDGYWTVAKRIRRNIDPLPEQDLEHLFALYDRGVAYTDYWLGELIQGLKARGLDERTLLVITSDHGDELLDHGGVEHGETFYDEMIRVPLIMRVPGLATGRTVEEQVGLVDLMPTMLELLRIPHDLFLQGRSFVPLLEGASYQEAPVFSEASINPGQRSVRTRDWKYIELRSKRELYDLRNDPRETRNLCGRDEQRCADFAAKLRAWQAENTRIAKQLALPEAPKAEVDEETRERLRALGYHD